LGALLAALPPLSAQISIFNVEEGLPVQITDTVANRRFALQGAALYDRKRVNQGDKKRDKDSYLLSSELQYGWGNWQIQAEWLRLTGSAERTVQITTAGLFRTLNQQKGLIPSTAVLGKVSFPIGDQSEGYDTSLRFLAALSAGASERAPRFIFNAEWFRNDKPREEQRRNIYTLSGGYVIRLTRRFLVVADLVWSQADERGIMSRVAEAGTCVALFRSLFLCSGAGKGFGKDSPRFRFTFGLSLQQP